MNKGNIFIISGPSGCGKSTVLGIVFKEIGNYFFSVSATTRSPRKGEINGKNYYFVSKEQFEKMIENGELLEYTNYVGNYYGTPLKPIYENVENGIDVFLDVEVEGHKNVKEKIPDAVSIFIAPPSLEALSQRLRGRSTETEEVILGRLKTAEKEIALAPTYDFVVINDVLEDAATQIIKIIRDTRNK